MTAAGGYAVDSNKWQSSIRSLFPSLFLFLSLSRSRPKRCPGWNSRGLHFSSGGARRNRATWSSQNRTGRRTAKGQRAAGGRRGGGILSVLLFRFVACSRPQRPRRAPCVWSQRALACAAAVHFGGSTCRAGSALFYRPPSTRPRHPLLLLILLRSASPHPHVALFSVEFRNPLER